MAGEYAPPMIVISRRVNGKLVYERSLSPLQQDAMQRAPAGCHWNFQGDHERREVVAPGESPNHDIADRMSDLSLKYGGGASPPAPMCETHSCLLPCGHCWYDEDAHKTRTTLCAHGEAGNGEFCAICHPYLRKYNDDDDYTDALSIIPKFRNDTPPTNPYRY